MKIDYMTGETKILTDNQEWEKVPRQVSENVFDEVGSDVNCTYYTLIRYMDEDGKVWK